MEIVSTKEAPAAVGPYSQAVIYKDFVFASGQLGIDETGTVTGDISAQTKHAIEHLSKVLAAAGSSLDDVVKTTCFLADIQDFAAFNAVYAAYFTGKPARSLIQAAALPKGSLIEIEAIAIKTEKEAL